MDQEMLPLGIDRFEKIRTGGFYYIDKTSFIEELLNRQFEVNLITRPRRFGKTLMILSRVGSGAQSVNRTVS